MTSVDYALSNIPLGTAFNHVDLTRQQTSLFFRYLAEQLSTTNSDASQAFLKAAVDILKEPIYDS